MSRLFGGSGSQGDQAGKCCGFLSTCDANNPSPCSGKGVGACDNTTGWTVYRNDSWMCGYTAPLPDPDHPFSCKGSDNASGWQKCREQFYCVVDVLSQPARCVNMGPTDIPPNLNKLMCSENAACQALPGPHP